MKNQALRLLVPLAIAAFFLWRFLAGLDLHEVGRAIAGAKAVPLAVGIVLGVVVLVVRACRSRPCWTR